MSCLQQHESLFPKKVGAGCGNSHDMLRKNKIIHFNPPISFSEKNVIDVYAP
jgi:hypothetical protein